MKQSELLRKQADMMDMAEKYGIDDWRKLVKVTNGHGDVVTLVTPEYILFACAEPQFALGIVEGKPVFEGDELYGNESYAVQNKRKFTAKSAYKSHIVMEDGGCFACKDLTWNPPKPKTVMVELLVEDAITLAPMNHVGQFATAFGNVSKACHKALESIKQS